MKVQHWLLYHPERNSVPVAQETGRVTVWTGAQNHAHSDIKSPDQPAHIQLYPLCCPGPQTIKKRYNGHIRYTRSNNPQVAYKVKEILVQAYYKPTCIKCMHICICVCDCSDALIMTPQQLKHIGVQITRNFRQTASLLFNFIGGKIVYLQLQSP